MDENELQDLLGRAYHQHQVEANPLGAVSAVRQAVADPAARDAASAHLGRLSEVVARRTQLGVCGCHVSKVTHDILSEALREPA